MLKNLKYWSFHNRLSVVVIIFSPFLRLTFQYINWFSDPRVVDLPLISSSYQVPLIIFAYLYFVLDCGPRFMKNRPPYSLKTFIKLYNIVQILANVWLIYDVIDAGLLTSKLVCPVLDYSYDYIPMRVIIYM